MIMVNFYVEHSGDFKPRGFELRPPSITVYALDKVMGPSEPWTTETIGGEVSPKTHCRASPRGMSRSVLIIEAAVG